MRRILAFVFAMAAAGLFACSPAPAPDDASRLRVVDITPSPLPAPEPASSASADTIDVVLYVPDGAGGLVAVSAQAEDSPQGLLAALVAAGALPDVNYGRNITLSVGEETLLYDGTETSGVFVHLDLADAFAQAVKQNGAEEERLTLQSLANTFITAYAADGLILSIEGTDLETTSQRYDRPIYFDELAQTGLTNSANP